MRAQGVAAVLLVAVFVVLLAPVAHAQDAPPLVPADQGAQAGAGTGQGPHFPSGEDIARPLLAGLGDALSSWLEHSGPVLVARFLTGVLGAVTEWVWSAVGPLFGNVNVLTQLPPAWSYDLQPVRDTQARLQPVARAVLALGLVGGVAWGLAGLALGRPFGRLLAHASTFLLATGGLLVTPQLARWLIDLCNALSGALLSPEAGLPGLSAARGWDRASALGVVALVYLVVALLFFLQRLKLVVIVALLLAVSPLAVAVGALPLPLAQRFFGWWLSTLAGAIVVQVLQAAALGIGAALLAAPFVAGQTEGPSQGVLAAVVGVGAVVAAMALPGMLLGSLARAGPAPGALGTALQAATMLAGFGIAWRAAGAGPAVLNATFRTLPTGLPPAPGGAAVTPAPSGYVRSLLGGGGGVPMLPAPKE